MNEYWFKEGKQMAAHCDCFTDALIPECPWPIYTPEGIAWLQGWNSVAKQCGDLDCRPENCGHLFIPINQQK